MRKARRANHNPTFGEIILNIVPLLKNGITPEHQTILNVLESIAKRVDVDRWQLTKSGQQELDLFHKVPIAPRQCSINGRLRIRNLKRAKV
jgi:hypothetical protein